MTDRSTGEILKRRWGFGSICSDGHCRTEFSRTSDIPAESSTALLHAHAGHYVASFPRISDGCEERPGWFAAFTGHFRLWWSRDGKGLVAIETGSTEGGDGCGPAGERILWTAKLKAGFPTVRALRRRLAGARGR